MTGVLSTPPTIDRIGTDEALWLPWLSSVDTPELPLPRAARVTVVAAHPDDDVLGVGGLIAALSRQGCRLRFVALTDGDGSHPRSTVLAPTELARVRRAETRAALTALGAGPGAEVIRLGLADGHVAEHARDLRAALEPLVADADLVLAPWSADAHPDHEAAGRAARAVSTGTGVTCWEFPIWAWHWGRPDDPRIPWNRARRLAVEAADHRRKNAAIACFATQIAPLGPGPEEGPVLTAQMLAHFRRRTETVLV